MRGFQCDTCKDFREGEKRQTIFDGPSAPDGWLTVYVDGGGHRHFCSPSCLVASYQRELEWDPADGPPTRPCLRCRSLIVDQGA